MGVVLVVSQPTCAVTAARRPMWPAAQPAPRAPMIDYPARSIVPATAPVMLPGGASISDAGALRYELPIEVAPGPSGMQPALAIALGGDGHLAIEGVSAIAPCAAWYCLDGEPLVRFDDPDYTAPDGTRALVLHTRRETFQRIVAELGDGATPAAFRVHQPDGVTRTYRPRAGRYLVERVEDLDGYHLDYRYDGAGEIAAIDYGHGAGLTARRHVVFHREAGQVRRIEVLAPNPTAVEPVWRYDLGYDRGLLSSVQRCASAGGCTWARRFDWSRAAPPRLERVHDGSVATYLEAFTYATERWGQVVRTHRRHDGLDADGRARHRTFIHGYLRVAGLGRHLVVDRERGVQTIRHLQGDAPTLEVTAAPGRIASTSWTHERRVARGGAVSVLPAEIATRVVDGGGPGPSERTRIEHDRFGNRIGEVTTRDGVVIRSTRARYENRLAPWLLGLPARIERRAGAVDAARVEVTVHDALGRPVRVVTGAGEGASLERVYGYDRHGNRVATIAIASDEPAPRVTTVEYDADGVHPYRTTDALGSATISLRHPALGVEVLARDELGVQSRSVHDAFGRPVSWARPGAASVRHAYREVIDGPRRGVRIDTTATDDTASYRIVDGAGRLLEAGAMDAEGAWSRVTVPADPVVREPDTRVDDAGVVRNGFGEVIAETRGGRTIRTTYDPLGRPVAVSGPDGVRSRTYGTSGPDARRLVRETSPDGVVVEIAHDSLGRPRVIRRTAGGVTEVVHRRYDAAGRLRYAFTPRGTLGLRYRRGQLDRIFDASGCALSTDEAPTGEPACDGPLVWSRP